MVMKISNKIRRIDTEIKEKKMNDSERSSVKINGLHGYNDKYESMTTFESIDFAKNKKLNSIALFVNEYVPNHFPEGDYVKYMFIINGKLYDIVPINSAKPGHKIIKYSKNIINLSNVGYLKEEIKSVKLKIEMRSYRSKETPIISNIKLLYNDLIEGFENE